MSFIINELRLSACLWRMHSAAMFISIAINLILEMYTCHPTPHTVLSKCLFCTSVCGLYQQTGDVKQIGP